jgi:hypothetical protein
VAGDSRTVHVGPVYQNAKVLRARPFRLEVPHTSSCPIVDLPANVICGGSIIPPFACPAKIRPGAEDTGSHLTSIGSALCQGMNAVGIHCTCWKCRGHTVGQEDDRI